MYWPILLLFQLLLCVSAQNDCSKEIELLGSNQLQKNIFIGCRITNGSYSNDTIAHIFDSFYCGSPQEQDNSTSVTTALSSENRLFRWSRMCLIFQNQSETFLLYTLTVDTAQPPGFTLYIERNLLPNLRLKRTPIYKVFPHINLRLPADFFYPFSCKASSTSLNLASICYKHERYADK
ncbi:hypothetical protein M3Y97_00747200 [Aphelenchoides bicaudatus]|nr:hypothetical protein M3Y97_00747200 [Aphelenchoides bicaudatus]